MNSPSHPASPTDLTSDTETPPSPASLAARLGWGLFRLVLTALGLGVGAFIGLVAALFLGLVDFSC